MERVNENTIECFVRYQDLLTDDTRGAVARYLCLDRSLGSIYDFYREFYETLEAQVRPSGPASPTGGTPEPNPAP